MGDGRVASDGWRMSDGVDVTHSVAVWRCQVLEPFKTARVPLGTIFLIAACAC